MKVAAILVVLMLIASCGGRVSRPVSIETNLDSRLSCSHIKGEYSSNEERIIDLEKEALFQSQQNVGRVLTGQIFFLDANDEEEEEIQALGARNERLTIIAAEKSCGVLTHF